MVGNKAFGGVSLPLKTEAVPSGELPHQPPILPRRAVIRGDSQSFDVESNGMLISMRAEIESIHEAVRECESKGSSAKRLAVEAQSVANVANWKMNAVIGIASLTFLTIVGGFAFLFHEQQTASEKALKTAQGEARATILESKDTMMQSLRAERDEAVRLAVKRTLEEQSRLFAARKDPDVVTPH